MKSLDRIAQKSLEELQRHFIEIANILQMNFLSESQYNSRYSILSKSAISTSPAAQFSLETELNNSSNHSNENIHTKSNFSTSLPTESHDSSLYPQKSQSSLFISWILVRLSIYFLIQPMQFITMCIENAGVLLGLPGFVEDQPPKSDYHTDKDEKQSHKSSTVNHQHRRRKFFAVGICIVVVGSILFAVIMTALNLFWMAQMGTRLEKALSAAKEAKNTINYNNAFKSSEKDNKENLNRFHFDIFQIFTQLISKK